MNSLARAVQIINQLQTEGLIGEYYIGGATGANFYIDPVNTADVDIFVQFEETDSLILNPLSPIYARLMELGYTSYGQDGSMMVEGLPIQFLSVKPGMETEALKSADRLIINDKPRVEAPVPLPEFFIIFALATGRQKDRLRVRAFLDADQVSIDDLAPLLMRYGLREVWKKWSEEL